MTAFEVVETETILGFAMFTIALISLCYQIFKNGKK
ncbi:putative holin-like toxin [Streptococcus sobrinus]|uniref:Holin-like toxin n=1 Tax=Streptococcus sobrinus TaxID=1310 RepID=A0ABN5LJ23_9STRE|nr:putative holin-like toxin [Streptococcus sobrinus]AWN21065.1 putative holin-like toxin [Streptococcus sobrinus]EMP69879.1 hypothetical protein D823_10373 [Streptococcus sobrinus DSM 20742 = ATCC 33478]